MKASEKKQIEELLKGLTYNTKTRKLAFKRKDGATYFTGACVTRFKNDLKKLLDSFKVDKPELSLEEQEEREYKAPEHKYLVTLTKDPKAPVMWECKSVQDVFMQTRTHTQSNATNPFTVVDVATTYRVMDRNEWDTPEMDKKWKDYSALKKDFG